MGGCGEVGDERVQGEKRMGEIPLCQVKELRLRAMGSHCRLHSSCSAQNGPKRAVPGERGGGQPSRRDDSGLNWDTWLRV